MSNTPPRQPQPERLLPKAALYAAGFMILASLTVATIGSVTGYRIVRAETPPVAAERVLSFEQLADGSVRVRENGEEIALVLQDESGFLLNVLRGFSYKRRLNHVDLTAPYRVMRFDERRMAMVDLETGDRYTLHAHGQRNIAIFSELVPMPDAETAPTTGALDPTVTVASN